LPTLAILYPIHENSHSRFVNLCFNHIMSPSLTPFLKSRGDIVVGTSLSPEELGYGVARNLVQSDYQGAIHFVRQKQGTLFERLPQDNDPTLAPAS